MRSLHDCADHYESLPDPLPEPPPIPYAYLLRCDTLARGRAKLDMKTQTDIVNDLRKALREETIHLPKTTSATRYGHYVAETCLSPSCR